VSGSAHDYKHSSRPASLPLDKDSVSWKVLREPMVLASGGRALLMQVAQPLVAAAVAEHSSYERDPWRRLAKTLAVMHKIVFGSPAESARQTRSLARTHAKIRGLAPDGSPYSASDPELLTWVWATLVDTSLVAFEASRGRLEEADRALYYHEQKLVARACGVPASSCPPTMCEFDAYLRRSIAEDLRLTSQGRAIADAVLRPPLREPFGMLTSGPFQLLTVGLMPEPLRDAYELSWSPAHEDLFQMWMLGARSTNAVVPRQVREMAMWLLWSLERDLRGLLWADP